MRFCDEWEAGVGWIAPEPEFIERASHAVASGGRVWVTDPLDGEGVVERIRALGEPAGVVQLLDRHDRDSAAIARRLGVPHHLTPFEGVEGAPFEVVKIANLPRWREVALWFPAERTLVCGDSLGTAAYYRAPGEPLGVHPGLRLTPPRRLGRLDPLHVLVGHGEGIHGASAALALEEAIRTARRRTPRWAVAFAGRVGKQALGRLSRG